MSEYDKILALLAQSPFRSRFRLDEKDKAYIRQKGMDIIQSHCRDFVHKRLAPAVIPNDGRQTPMRGHPVFNAQHGCACCCRGCLEKWHHIKAGKELSPAEEEYIVGLLIYWINRQVHF